MLLSWTEEAWEDYLYWQTTNKQNVKRINTLIKSMLRTPFEGIGKPEPLKYDRIMAQLLVEPIQEALLFRLQAGEGEQPQSHRAGA